MLELTIKLNQSHDTKTVEVRVKIIYNVTAGIAVIGIIAMLILATYFMIVLYNLFNTCVVLSDGTKQCPGISFDRYLQILGIVSGVFYTVLTVGLIGSYIGLNRSLKRKFKSEQIRELSMSINLMFLLLVTSFTLRTIFLFFEGHYYLFVEQMFWRNELQQILWPCFDLMALCPILFMHQKNFGHASQSKSSSFQVQSA
jgi:hypothetical protein